VRTRRRRAVPVLLPGKHSKQELQGLIEDYRQGLLPLIVPLTLLRVGVEAIGERCAARIQRGVASPEGKDAADRCTFGEASGHGDADAYYEQNR
jgi:hypothetical protein